MKFSILVPAYNEEHSISTCLNSLCNLTNDSKEIIVIDDASTDQTPQIVENFSGKNVILIKREKNGGRAAALNSGLEQAKGDIIITTDADTIVPANWLQLFATHFQSQDVVAAGGAYQAQNKTNPLVHATSILDQILNGMFKKSLIPNKLSGVNSAIRKKALLDIGGFNEDAWWSEDSEAAWKLQRIGKIIYDPENIVHTLYPETWAGIWNRKYYWGYAMGLKFRERLPFNLKLWIRPLLFMTFFISFVASFLTAPYDLSLFLIPFLIFLLVFSSLTIFSVPFGTIIMLKNKEPNKVKTLSALAVLPLIREFAYVYGMGFGFLKGKSSAISPSWKRKTD
ncbi:MAG: glycosyltransferase family 2 protein [Candidatus Brocadiaceae bacterium]|nr:glycosyltransferase family 2 protein [Candidatus Brocadiaceae bacterium]